MQDRGSFDSDAIKARQREAWSSIDYAPIGATFVIVSETLCEAVDLRAGQRVLDVATGSGNAAIAAARRFCEVTGIDYAVPILDTARRRAAAEGLAARFLPGDAESIPFPDASFDIVLSVFGAMLSPGQEKTASELLRVCRPGGKIGMANWTPDSLPGEIHDIMARYVEPPPGLVPATLWGTEKRLTDLFDGGTSSLRAVRRSLVMRYHTVEHWLAYFRSHAGPVAKVFESLDPPKQESLSRDLAALVRGRNRSGDGTLVVSSDYLEVVAVRRAGESRA